MRIKLILHGKLKQVVGQSELLINVDTAQQAVSFLLRSFQGLRQVLRRGMYRFSLTSEGRSDLLSGDSRLDLALPINVDTIHLVPIEGVYSKKALGIILGIQLVYGGLVLAFTPGFQPLGLALLGIGVNLLSSSLSPKPKTGDLAQADTPENRQSTLFTSATNRTAKGVSVPVLYGTFLTGSNVISQSVLTEEVL